MPVRPCLGCGGLIASGSYCPRCDPSRRRRRRTPGRSSRAQARFRAAAVAAYGNRCARCGASGEAVRLYAHHPTKVRAGGAVERQAGVLLCAPCHAVVERG